MHPLGALSSMEAHTLYRKYNYASHVHNYTWSIQSLCCRLAPAYSKNHSICLPPYARNSRGGAHLFRRGVHMRERINKRDSAPAQTGASAFFLHFFAFFCHFFALFFHSRDFTYIPPPLKHEALYRLSTL
jgi:hypothetical protein